MILNNMTGDTNGGLCLIKKYEYCTYEQDLTCNCVDVVTTGVTTYLPMGIYILPKVNTNLNYSVNTVDESIAIVVDSISGFTESYITDLVTTGYTSYDDSGFENRIIYDSTLNKYFYFENDLNSTNCSIITDSLWAIIVYETGDLYNGVGPYWYVELNDCGDPTGNKYVYLSDINPNSLTYGQTQTILKCN